ncbi:MAG TPA: pantothenate kinase [Marinilabiliales bacterium]|jgi:type III pantothenate kinase|nr:MAG: hypothetical protein A2W95_10025 [Bacteroidetes bacterium GWA2_40_14]OFX63120.1 MAG: hypothetical protein A2W84_03505 [Bacteroidetes bacterium GWC2_40_13]OFX75734.1 MAG: hypothetical protein A2W96_09200 [Bacteroidetes bacterium GWD2_40_43]OFX94993.1 MAG: hypothetical protein A2W97_16640 [Bacteroidetes bacterium GWE2_40_63]OFY23504.1 MAG: hypothetical protein A2W88_08455 [Bacteroidetes bacterium GWF2_40_13]OFZ29370.1 MAG: hypothetical protein A2437_09145 [Bacteroidetes bacterium RIFOXYC
MNLIIDVGNTQCKVSVFEGSTVVCQTQNNHLNEIPWASLFQDYNLKNGIFSDTRGVGLNTVSQFLPPDFPVIELNAELPLPITINYKTPHTLGKDRIAGAVAANHQFYGLPVLIIDIGTAITIDFVSEHGTFMGGIISPGPELRYRALHQFTGKLPLLEPVVEAELTPTTTKTAIEGGVQNGILFEINGYIQHYQAIYQNLKIVLTGGFASMFENKLKSPFHSDALLVQKGLNLILYRWLNTRGTL